MYQLLYWLYVVPWIIIKLSLRMLFRNKIRQLLPMFYRFHPANAYSIGRGRLRHLYYEDGVDKTLKKALSRGGVFIDLGANIGSYTFLAGKIVGPEGRVIAVDPDPRIQRYLLSHPIVKSAKNIIVMGKAVWTSKGIHSLSLGKSTLFTSLTPLKRFKNSGAFVRESIGVETVRLEDLTQAFKTVDVIKMDIEGAEYPVLTDPSLGLGNVKTLIIEMHYTVSSKEAKSIIAALKRHGYKVYLINPKAMKENPYRIPSISYQA